MQTSKLPQIFIRGSKVGVKGLGQVMAGKLKIKMDEFSRYIDDKRLAMYRLKA